ncbi:MAG: energy transducer TonB [Terriglobales bacterium]
MFGDTLLESSSVLRKHKRWPMATAFTVEAIVAAIVVIVPLLSTGVIPVSARVPLYTPLPQVTVEPDRVPADGARVSGPATSPQRQTAVILVSDNKNQIHLGPPVETTTNPTLATPGLAGRRNLPSELIANDGPSTPNVRLGPKRIVSQLTEAQLLSRVEPVYPRIAVLTGVQGQVKLHAIIARDGTIQSLSAISGHPLLVRAALDAVGQWRYRPYILNGEAVEVETFITVNFRKDAH